MSERDRFCPGCGAGLVDVLRGGRSRRGCPRCGRILWRNPMAAVAVILRDGEGKVLLVRRAGTHPGAWCIPCGHIEAEEEIREAGRRELLEETGLAVAVGQVYAVLSNFHDAAAPSVGIWFLGTVTGGTPRPGGDADALGWFAPDAPPGPLAFPTDERVLRALAVGLPFVE